jgi:putative salt-induced outer membrane protein YdiY/preprotein translocase subunit YajC
LIEPFFLSAEPTEGTVCRSAKIVFLLLVSFFVANNGFADEVRLKNGDRLSGEIQRVDGETVAIATSYAGEIRVPRDAVVAIGTDASVVVVFQNGDSVTGRLSPSGSDSLELATERFGRVGPFRLSDLQSVARSRRQAAIKVPSAAAPRETDEVLLNDGDRILGTVKEISAKHVIIATAYAGEIRLPRENVASIATHQPVTVIFQNDDYLTGRFSSAPEGALRLDSGSRGVSREFQLAEVKEAYRGNPQQIVRSREAVKLSGRVNLGLDIDSGNSDNESYHLDGQIRARTPKNRYTLTGEFDKKRSGGKKSEEKMLGSLKYDHFLTKQWFLFNSATFEHDEFKDLNLRTSLGAGVGYQFFERNDLSLSVEGGLSYVNENFEIAADQDYPGGRWAVDYEQDIFSWTRLFHFHEGLLGTDIQNLKIRSRTGLRFPLGPRFRATGQLNLDWDNSPPKGSTGTDRKYLFTLGYEW